MTSDAVSRVSTIPEGYLLAPIHPVSEGAPLTVCVVIRSKHDAAQGRFIVLREVPGSRVYLGAMTDAGGRIHEWLEIWVQTVELTEPGVGGPECRLENRAFDQQWHQDFIRAIESCPEDLIVTGTETQNPPPLLINPEARRTGSPFVESTPTRWRLCRDDALLESLGVPSYSKSAFRYLYDPLQDGEKSLIATQDDAPTNERVRGPEQLIADAKGIVLNAQAGRLRVQRLTPLDLDDYLGVLEGAVWAENGSGALPVLRNSVYADFQQWSRTPKGLPFLLHGRGDLTERLNEILFLKLSVLRDLFREVRACVKAHQLPLLNLTPASFAVRLQAVGEAFPALWTARGILVKPGQAHPIELKGTDQRYFVRLGRIQPSPYLPEELGAHSAGTGMVRVRDVVSVSGGIVIEGTLLPQDHLAIRPDDLLWFRPSLEGQRLEFHAHVDPGEHTGPKEVRFRTVPAMLPPPAVAALKSSVGTVFPRSPYEVWPLLSSPGDLYSLGVFAIRILFANAGSKLAVVKDEILSLSRSLGKDTLSEDALLPRLMELLDNDAKLTDLVSPDRLSGLDLTPDRARALVVPGIWWETVCLVLRLFPGIGPHSYCRGCGDVSPLALEMAFDRPLQELDALVLRQRSLLTPNLMANQEIAGVLLDELDRP